jgi:DNA-binding XRE family transcriptional regulator
MKQKTKKHIALTDVINKKCKNKEFAEVFQRELLINEIAKLIVELRIKAHMTQKALAERTQTTQPVIARLESGTDRRIPSLDLLTRIAIATNSKLNIAVSIKGDR